MVDRILSINPGATSTKIGYFEDDHLKLKKEFTYAYDEIIKYDSIIDQYNFRLKDIIHYLKNNRMGKNSLDAVVGRGGLLPPVEAGAYIVNDDILECLKKRPLLEHASNLGASLAKGISEEFGTPISEAYIYDPVTVDQLDDVARISGIKEIERKSVGHVLNMRAVSIKVAQEKLNKSYEDANIVVVHAGGGSTASAHKKGRIVELISDDEALFSTERSGGLPLKQIIPMCYENTIEEMTDMTRRNGGLVSYFGTNDTREVVDKARHGDEQAALVLHAMAYQIAKTIGELSTVLYGDIDAIILTGGLANSDYVMNFVKERVSFLSTVYLVPGEEELAALAEGARRVLIGKEKVNIFNAY